MADKLSEDKIKFIIENYTKLGAGKVAAELGIFRCTARKYAQQHGIIKPYRTKEVQFKEINSRFNMDDFENIKRPEVAYFLGYLWADGHVTGRDRKSSHTIGMAIVKDDFDEIKDTLLSVGGFSIYYPSYHGRGRPQGAIRASHAGLFKFLESKNYLIKSGGSLEPIIRHLPKELFRFFVRGLVDGDGCICVSKKKGSLCGAITISSTYDQDWDFLVLSIKEACNAEFTIRRHNKKDGTRVSVVEIHDKESILLFLNYIYSGREVDKIGLTRKYVKFAEYVAKVDARAENMKKTYARLMIPVRIFKGDDFIGEFQSIRLAAKTLGVTHGVLQKTASGLTKKNKHGYKVYYIGGHTAKKFVENNMKLNK